MGSLEIGVFPVQTFTSKVSVITDGSYFRAGMTFVIVIEAGTAIIMTERLGRGA